MTDTTRESVEELYDGPCEAGCQHYHGGEVRHHRDCGHYPESFSKMFDDCAAERDSLLSELDAARTALAAAEAREGELREALEQLLGNATAPHASFETGCCMCGVDMAAGVWAHEGHNPTDSGLYYAELAIDEARAALKKGEG